MTPLVLVSTAIRAYRLGDRRLLVERLGKGESPGIDAPLWIHAASVGEVNAARPLVTELYRRRPDLPLLMTTVTPTGADAVARLAADIHHSFLPWDTRGAVDRFLRRFRPRCAVIMETELWPNLFRSCRARGIAPLIVNGRLSQKSMDAGTWLKRAQAAALRNCAAVLARSDADAERFVELGAPPHQVRSVGNIKYAPGFDLTAVSAQPALPRPYVLLASTHDDEELRIARAWVRATDGRGLLVIAPRHPQRSSQLVRQLQQVTPNIAVRSWNQSITGETALYLADTLGELPWLMHHAQVVFMGGSLIPRGGHNLLEPALLGKAIISGPHTDNFADERTLLEQAGALRIVDDEVALVDVLRRLLDDATARGRLEHNARSAVAKFEGIARAYADAVLTHCEC